MLALFPGLILHHMQEAKDEMEKCKRKKFDGSGTLK
jgi:hypothetical protein